LAGICKGGISPRGERKEGAERRKTAAHLLDVASSEADDDETTIPSDTLEGRDDHADGIVHTVKEERRSAPKSSSRSRASLDSHVGSMTLGDLHDLLLPISLGSLSIVDSVIGAIREADVQLGLSRAGGNDLGA